MQALPNTRSCFVCGVANPAGLQLHFETDGQSARCQFTPRPEHVGFKDTVHGGLLATVLDEIMVWAIGVQKRQFTYCAELNVRFHHPARPGDALSVVGQLTLDRRGRIYEASGTVTHASGILVATATGKYMPIKAPDAEAMLADLIGPLDALGLPAPACAPPKSP
jgi:acyl-coenzyme A thioesterase PaaI-like protein